MTFYSFQTQLKCTTGQGQCPVAYETRRKCKKCRLHRCFAMGMRKDFLLSEEEKQRRKRRLKEYRNTTLQCVSNAESIPPTFENNDHVNFYAWSFTSNLFFYYL